MRRSPRTAVASHRSIGSDRATESARALLLGAHRRVALAFFHGAAFDVLRAFAAQRDETCLFVPRSRPDHIELMTLRRARHAGAIHALPRFAWQQRDLRSDTFVGIDGRRSVRIAADFVNVDGATDDASRDAAVDGVRHVFVAQCEITARADAPIIYTLYYDDSREPAHPRNPADERFLARLRREFWMLLSRRSDGDPPPS
jgi:hypothetical protein